MTMIASIRTTLAATAVAIITLLLGGCAVGALVGGMAESAHRAGSSTIEAKYDDLRGHTFGVVVTADRFIQADHPGVVEEMTERITNDLVENNDVIGATGYIDARKTLAWLFDHPGWRSMSNADLARELGGIDRLIFIEIREYRLHDPGNQYTWSGVASGAVYVYETDDPVVADEIAFDEFIQVAYPFAEGYGPTDMSRNQVTSALLQIFVNRASWLFYTHEEPNAIEY